jgi:hypothetical protein
MGVLEHSDENECFYQNDSHGGGERQNVTVRDVGGGLKPRGGRKWYGQNNGRI